MAQIKITVPSSKARMAPSAPAGPRIPPQNFEALRRQCLGEGSLFEDPYFPATDTSMFFTQRPPRKFEWKRPKEICAKPKLFVGGASRMDIKQGMLGDCWLLAAIASLAEDETILKKVVPPDQDFDSRYAGIFHFRFWHFGKWVDIVVDDRLPTFNGKLVFLQSQEGNEFWSALLEKAYAKLYGSYEALKGGRTSEAMEDFTGGVVESYDLPKANDNLFSIMAKAAKKKALMSCSIKASPGETEAVMANGLVKGHAYSVTGAREVNATGGKVKLVRVRNPWGNEREWTGDWSDNSRKWDLLGAEEKRVLQLARKDDGEFWMAFDDFKREFSDLEVCNITLDTFDEDENIKSWSSLYFDGSWTPGVNAGGCRNYKDTFASNPQFVFDLQEDADGDGKCSILVALMQKHRRAQKKMGVADLCIGFSIYKVAQGQDSVDTEYILYHRSEATSGSFTNTREVFKRFDLEPGRYVLVLCTFKPNEEGDFLLRVFTEKMATPKEGDMQDKSDEEVRKQGVKALFDRLAGDDNVIDVDELQDLMTFSLKKDMSFPAFSMEACRTMICMLDEDDNGTLNFTEFQKLLQYISKWKVVFRQIDHNHSGTVERDEAFEALQKLGFDIPAAARSALFNRFAKKRQYMDFDDFVACCCRAELMHNVFRKYGSGSSLTLSKEDFFKLTFNA